MNLKYKKYDNYKPSGVEWLGDMPEHWEVFSLKRLVKSPLKYGANEPAFFNDRNLPRYIRITDFGNNGNLKSNTFKSLPLKKAKDYLLEEGDLLFARSGATVGKTFLFQNYKGLACFAGYLIKASFNQEKCNFKFIYYCTKSGYYNNWKNSIFIQATIQNIGADKYNLLPIPLPTLTEQTAIANFLDRKTAQIDKAIAQKEQLIELLKERRQILIHEAVTQGLDKSVEMKDRGVEWVGEVPKHWEVKKLGYLTTRIGDGLHGTPNYTDDATYYFINGNNLGNEKIKITEQTKTVNIKEYLLHKKDLSGNTILLSINGTIGNVSYYNYEPIMLGKSAAYINLLSNVNIRYIRLFLQSSIFKNYYELELSGSTIKNLSLHSIGKTPIVIPPKEEQQEIVSYIEAQNEKIKTAIKLKQQEIASLKEYKTVLIDAAVTGKVIVD